MKKIKQKEIKVITHYFKEDEDYVGDYDSVEITIDGKTVITYGDYYHDKGGEKAEGFIDGLSYILGKKVEFNKEDIADIES